MVRPFYLRHVYFPLFPQRRPFEFVRCWQAPHEFEGGRAQVEIPPPDPELPDVLFLPMTDWHHRLQRSQQLARELARLGRRCFLLNPHLGREYRQAPWGRRRAAVGRLEERIFEIHAPLPSEPVFHHRLLEPGESRQVADALGWALERAGARCVDVICALPTWSEAAQRLDGRWQPLLVYDCHDWLAGFPNMAAEIARAEPDAMRAADAVVFSAASLRERFCEEIPELAPRAFLVRNGVPEWPEAQQGRTERRVAGYVGALNERFWTEAVAAAARALPEVRFLLAGAPSPEVRRGLAGIANVELSGEVPHAGVPDVLRRCRVGLIPFQGALAPYTDPLKVYEYFHHGLPVAASRVPELDRFGGLVYQGGTVEEFVEAVRAALKEDDAAREAARREQARAATWRRRAEQLDEILCDARRRRRGPLS